MEQIRDLADSRLVNGCLYCGDPEETREHVPSKVFLDKPFPTNLPVVPACRPCNNGFAADEEYVACLIESVVCGSTDPDSLVRERIAEILRRSPRLRAKLESARVEGSDPVQFKVEQERVERVFLKLAQGHAAFELSQVCRRKPDSIVVAALESLPAEVQDEFQSAHIAQLLGEVGSRGMQRQFAVHVPVENQDGAGLNLGFVATDWVDVQNQQYRYLAIDDVGGIRVKILVREYLACEVVWCQ